jgi:hypothetical protein
MSQTPQHYFVTRLLHWCLCHVSLPGLHWCALVLLHHMRLHI